MIDVSAIHVGHDEPMRPNGLRPEQVRQIAAAIRAWPGAWSIDLAGGPDATAVVLIAEAGDRFAPALHVEQVGGEICVSAVRWDCMTPVGRFADLDSALCHLCAAITVEAARLGSVGLH